jgi:hypothetical protein
MNKLYNKLYCKNNNSLIHYINNGSSFDLLIDHAFGEKIIRINNSDVSEYLTLKSVLINNYQSYIMSDSYQNYYMSGEHDKVVFIHSDISYMKKEDIFLIKNRLQKFTIINLIESNNDLFDTNINIALPKIKISNPSAKRDRVLIIDNNNYKDIAHILKQTNIDVIDFSSHKDYYSLINSLADYNLVVYKNYIDNIVALSAGCSTISSIDILKNQRIVPSNISHANNTKINYDFATFSKILSKVIKL